MGRWGCCGGRDWGMEGRFRWSDGKVHWNGRRCRWNDHITDWNAGRECRFWTFSDLVVRRQRCERGEHRRRRLVGRWPGRGGRWFAGRCRFFANHSPLLFPRAAYRAVSPMRRSFRSPHLCHRTTWRFAHADIPNLNLTDYHAYLRTFLLPSSLPGFSLALGGCGCGFGGAESAGVGGVFGEEHFAGDAGGV